MAKPQLSTPWHELRFPFPNAVSVHPLPGLWQVAQRSLSCSGHLHEEDEEPDIGWEIGGDQPGTGWLD